jgi:malto-oligosyltrehalose synthase
MARVPTATYGLRLRPGFGYAEAGELAGYLAALGVSHVTAPLPGEDLDGFRAMAARLRTHGLGVVLDVDPPEPDAAPLLDEGLVDGLRVNHPDRLTDPRAYLRRLVRDRTWIVVRKILAEGEELAPDWPCAGTTGHDALGIAGGLFVDPAGEKPLTETYTRLTGGPEDFTEVERAGKRLAVDRLPEARELTGTLTRILPDENPDALREVVAALLVAMPVHRAYVVPGEEPPAGSLEIVAQAAAAARTMLAPDNLLDRVVPLVLGLGGRDPLRDEFAVRFQQASAATAAVGIEEIAFCRWPRFAALNEIGCDPVRFGVSPAEFHAHCARIARDRPRTLTALSAHDTRWQEDVRARLAAVSELPDEWTAAVGRWRSRAPGSPLEPDLDYLMWQAIVGAWPPSADRLTGFLTRALRMSRTGTSEEAAGAHAEAVLADATLAGDIAGFVERLAPFARTNSLGQKLVQLTMPGVPEVYQGCELTALSPAPADEVDYVRRRELLADLDAGTVPAGLDGEKLLITSRALRLRGRHPHWFSGGYEPLSAVGPAASHVLAYRRGGAAIVVTRLPAGLERGGGWDTTSLHLPGGPWRELLTGRSYGPVVALTGLLSLLPVAILTEAT